MKEGKEKNGGTATSFVDPALSSSGSGTHPHRGEVRLPVVDDRLPVLCLPSNAIQLLRPSFYIVKLVGRGFRSLIPLPRSVSPFLSSERRFAISRESCETFGIASRNKYILPTYFETFIGEETRRGGRKHRLSKRP